MSTEASFNNDKISCNLAVVEVRVEKNRVDSVGSKYVVLFLGLVVVEECFENVGVDPVGLKNVVFLVLGLDEKFLDGVVFLGAFSSPLSMNLPIFNQNFLILFILKINFIIYLQLGI